MARPYQYRDYPLFVFVVLASLFIGLTVEQLQLIEITLSHVCQQESTCPVIISLSALPEAMEVRREVVAGRDVVLLKATRALSTQQIMDSVGDQSCSPSRLVVDHCEVFSKPLN